MKRMLQYNEKASVAAMYTTSNTWGASSEHYNRKLSTSKYVSFKTKLKTYSP